MMGTCPQVFGTIPRPSCATLVATVGKSKLLDCCTMWCVGASVECGVWIDDNHCGVTLECGVGVECGMGVECGVWSVQCAVWSEECGVWTGCGVWSVECALGVECGVWLSSGCGAHTSIPSACQPFNAAAIATTPPSPEPRSNNLGLSFRSCDTTFAKCKNPTGSISP